ncbi:hypothetical protein [Streptomyces avicenniae]|uniref:hypothetical protein n=1 Tax=Streptomyces avicenniae TaxID=500153 RepID=UPI00069B5F4B|nr:hypothetical protein [Streptomyces avicenniae]
MPEWRFTVVLNRGMTESEADCFDTLDEPLCADGSVSYTRNGPGPSRLVCGIEAPRLLEAVARAASAIRRIPGLRAVAAERDDLLTLEEAAERLPDGPSRDELTAVARARAGDGLPAPEGETDGTPYYSWPRIVSSLRGLGYAAPDADRDIELADLALRTRHELEAAHVPDAIRRALGLSDTL